MKFAKELERDCVPEWRAKYLDYKQGKKKLKAISRALRSVNQTPRFRRRDPYTFTPPAPDTTPTPHSTKRYKDGLGAEGSSQNLRDLAFRNSSHSNLREVANGSGPSKPKEAARPSEEQPLQDGQRSEFPGMTRYGSIIGSPTNNELHGYGRNRKPPALELPDPALDPDAGPDAKRPAIRSATAPEDKSKSVTLPPTTGNAFEIGKTRSPGNQTSSLPGRHRGFFSPKRVNSMPGNDPSRPLFKRMFSVAGMTTPQSEASDVALEAYRDLDFRQAEFFNFMDGEFEKIEGFYKQKEVEATERLNVLRDQLHIMRDRRLEDIVSIQAAKMKAKELKKNATEHAPMNGQSSGSDEDRPDSRRPLLHVSWLKPVDSALEAVKAGRHGKATKGMEHLGTPSALRPMQRNDENRDYTRRPEPPDVPYRSAKRKLKTALQEYYRGLELLKSYALLNRTAFRKINKKYDKTVNARPPLRYMTEKVNKARFVQSDVIDGHIRTVEDLYARYFEQGNHKVAVGKLRVKAARAGDFTENSFRNGLTLAAGMVFGIQGLVYGSQLEYSPNPRLASDTSYLLQIYAGFFLMNFLFLLFCLACRVWHESKINYVFVFEYDTRHHVDWRQLCELPCFFIFLLGLVMWLNFNQFGGYPVYTYYPVILIGITAVILFFPAPIIYHRSRTWLLYSIWRLVCAGLYPVEFRDFYLGDMFCSLTYSMGNIELFFCLYANDWSSPAQCNSTHSRLLGFFTTLPGIWRALQCIRRYYDTRNVFPHLVNCGKYAATISYYLTLSVYRLNQTHQNKAIFITFATVNAVYCSIWDIVMDWSLFDPYARHRFLRETLGYKRVWMYYVAMVVDPILRFNWIFYAIWRVQIQHSAILSFAVALSEAFRRGMWTLFRVENEHCTNVGRFRASRDVPLPYEMPSDTSTATGRRPSSEQRRQGIYPPKAPGLGAQGTPASQALTSSVDLEAATRTHSNISRRRGATSFREQPSPMMRGLSRMGSILHTAHAQDFERKKKPELGSKADLEDDSDDDEDEAEATGSGQASASAGRSPAGSDEDVEEARMRKRIGTGSVEEDDDDEEDGKSISPTSREEA